jgi:hypothetical protein
VEARSGLGDALAEADGTAGEGVMATDAAIAISLFLLAIVIFPAVLLIVTAHTYGWDYAFPRWCIAIGGTVFFYAAVLAVGLPILRLMKVI